MPPVGSLQSVTRTSHHAGPISAWAPTPRSATPSACSGGGQPLRLAHLPREPRERSPLPGFVSRPARPPAPNSVVHHFMTESRESESPRRYRADYACPPDSLVNAPPGRRRRLRDRAPANPTPTYAYGATPATRNTGASKVTTDAIGSKSSKPPPRTEREPAPFRWTADRQLIMSTGAARDRISAPTVRAGVRSRHPRCSLACTAAFTSPSTFPPLPLNRPPP